MNLKLILLKTYPMFTPIDYCHADEVYVCEILHVAVIYDLYSFSDLFSGLKELDVEMAEAYR